MPNEADARLPHIPTALLPPVWSRVTQPTCSTLHNRHYFYSLSACRRQHTTLQGGGSPCAVM